MLTSAQPWHEPRQPQPEPREPHTPSRTLSLHPRARPAAAAARPRSPSRPSAVPTNARGKDGSTACCPRQHPLSLLGSKPLHGGGAAAPLRTPLIAGEPSPGAGRTGQGSPGAGRARQRSPGADRAGQPWCEQGSPGRRLQPRITSPGPGGQTQGTRARSEPPQITFHREHGEPIRCALLSLLFHRWGWGGWVDDTPLPYTNSIRAVALPGNSSPSQAGALCSPSLLLSFSICFSLSPGPLRCCPCPLPFHPPPFGPGLGCSRNAAGNPGALRALHPFTPSSLNRRF